jgi:Putative DNA-binding domain
MPVGPSIGKELFDRIVAHPGYSDTVALLNGMVNATPPAVEDEYLDFKGATDPKTGREIDPKKTWSEALAGFATTGGGVLIWGIDARKDASGVDHAGALNLVPSPSAWKSRLQELHLQATDPPVPGVRIEAYPDPSNGGKGFVVCYIPESDYKPHRAETANRRWMMRIGSNFVDVPPPVLRSLFFPCFASAGTGTCLRVS